MEGLELFTSIPRLVREIDQFIESDDKILQLYDEFLRRTQNTLRLINDLLLLDTTTRDVEYVIGLTRILSHLEDCKRRLTTLCKPSVMPTLSTYPQPGVGRPRADISLSALRRELEISKSWNAAARALGVSRTTLHRRREEFGLATDHPANKYSDISDDDLDVIVKGIIEVSPTAGGRLLMHILRGRGIVVQRERLRRSMRRLASGGKTSKSTNGQRNTSQT